MRKIIIVKLICAWCSVAHSTPLTEGCWIPLKYVMALSASVRQDTKEMLIPFQSITVNSQGVLVKAYGSEESVAQLGYDGGRIEILNVERFVNLMYFDLKEVSETRYFLSTQGFFLILSMESATGMSEIKFVNEFQGFAFSTFYGAVFRIQMAKHFCIVGVNECLSFTMDGKVKNSSSWSRYELIRDYPDVSNGRVVNRIKIVGKKEEEFAAEIKDKFILFYRYTKDKFQIELSDRPVYTLQLVED
ncbi:hypothetical protein SAMN04488109_0105 [Chryseolinea serpens]|uniref:Uncharacterized protein n=1 Tax=Chryseolinea serpens TaxID=947013 RepID=A0A1M5JJL0_9BACT|nr:hypothetical protein [Chryseolinea serpens]SHG40764.1 hypothetical protein SAMN04488109_0105 [Chryseolinea serpens]